MSSSNKSGNLPTNEQEVEDVFHDMFYNAPESNISQNENTEQKLENSEYTGVPEDFEKSDSEEQENTVPDDFIDEGKLKDLEQSLTEEEILERHKNALDYKIKGNEEFKQGRFLEASNFYTQGLRICPLKFDSDRAALYANRGAAKVTLDRNKSAIDDCTKAIELNGKYLRAYLRRARLYEKTDKLEESLEDYKKIMELDPGNQEAVAAQVRLPPIINEKNEKLKAEMLGKLKELGNVILKPFGLSTDNFKLNQDPNTGGYSVNFSQGTK